MEDPELGDGWDFMDQESQAWYEALETTEPTAEDEYDLRVDIDAYDEFDDIKELVNFVAGTGEYSDTRRFTPGEKDREMLKQELHNDKWKIPAKLEQISEYLEEEENIDTGEINLDPTADVELQVTETDARKTGADTKYTMHFIAYDQDEDLEKQRGEPDNQVYLKTSWYDTPPEEINLEDLFDSVMEKEK